MITESIRTALRREILEEGRKADEILVLSILRSIPQEVLLREAVPIVLREAEHIERQRTREVERTFPRFTPEALAALTATGNDPLSLRNRLARETFDIGIGVPIYWDQATAEQHEMRAAMQRKMARGCILDAERHEQAAQLIREKGVKCLADLLAEAS